MSTDDLAKIDHLDEKVIIEKLRERYEAKQIYTYVGDIILAVNPFEQLPLYTNEVKQRYLSGARGDKDPHLYHLAYVGYEDMMKSKHSQSFVISGESGAGKSESTKHLINHIIENSKSNKKSLESRIQMINPLLEAFGNAKTVMNNNSSRFGKYIEIKFSPVDGAVMGAAISEYLLEKSRVCSQQPNEQNYHIFYILSAGMAQCEVLSYDLGKPSSHNYLNSPGAPTDAQIMCKDNVESFNELLETFIKMQFDDEDVQSMLTILCAVLLIGDIEFKLNSSDEVEYAGDSSKLLGEIAKLLNVPVAELEPAFLAVTQLMGSEAVKIPFNSVEKAVDNRDAFAKAFYARLFGWIVTHCNQTLIDPETVSGDFLSLGILDIFGFEDFANNSLEQLCINVTNEQLHTFFNETIFKAEAESYKAEGVDGADIAWENNEPTLMMLRARPGGLLAILDEESNPKIKSSDLQFTEKAGAALAKHASGAYKSAKSSKELSFTIVHYAGPVKYNSTNFLEKDRDTLSAAFAPVLKFSQDTMVSQLWSAKSGATGTFKVHKSMKGRPPKSKKKLQNTVCAHFSASLTDLLDKIKASNPHFVRCLKPNAEKVPKKFDNAQMMRQLKYAGVLETVKVRKLGYAIRETFEDFVKHYKNMAFPHGQKVPSTAKSCEVIMEKTNIEGYKIGKSKIFLKYFHVEQLAALRKKEVWALEFVKKVCSGHIARVRFKRIKARCAEQTAMIAAMIAFAEDSANAVREKVVKVTAMDAAATKKRKFVADLKKKAAAEEKEKLKEEEEARKQLEKEEKERAETLKRTRKKGFKRGEQLTMKVGKLPEHWEKKIDKATGRAYFKNHQTRQTTWIDPRTKFTRKQDAASTVGEELPYGWDAAETNGEKYYIDHLNQQTHWIHPRMLLEEKRLEYVEREEETQARAQTLRDNVKDLRAKRSRLAASQLNAATDEQGKDLQNRVEAMDVVIDAEMAELKVLNDENQQLKNDIKKLNNAFAQAAHVQAGGSETTFVADDVTDLYAIEKQESLPRKLDTLTRKKLTHSGD